MTSPVLSTILNGISETAKPPAAVGGNFLSMIDSALQSVSSAQSAATSAEASYAAGLPGASLGTALVSSDRAEIAWNATVAVRNEVVSAYQSIMNMPL
jgi:flagellar hook-basal body complex protein FliE